MKNQLSPTLIGAFVLGGGALLLIALLAFGGASLFTKPQRFAVFFDESVHGLDPGAPVKVRGVRVGRVADVSVRFDAAKHDSVVEVVCEVSRNVLVAPDGQRIDFSAPGQIEHLVKDGMRAELAVMGLATGMLYVELGFDEEQKYPISANLPQADMPVVPAVPSAIAEFTASVSDLLGKLRQVDYAGISTELKTLLASVRTKIDGLELQPAVDEVKSAAAAVRVLASDPKIGDAFASVNRTLAELTAMIGHFDQQVVPAGEELQRTLAEARAAMAQLNGAAASVRALVGPQTGLGDEAVRTLQRVGDAAEAMQRLVDFLERNPQALLSGRSAPAPANRH
ncbi:MAG TPA: MlaD family protein [Opitutaceae bacterium]|nr:MlaD family protein [Opitutaceae bacterium]